MSGLLAGKVWHSNLSAQLKPLAACLADEGNDQGHSIYPSIAYVAWKLSVSSRTVQRGMRDLRALGVIRKVGKKKFRRVFVPVYFLDVSKLPSRARWRDSRVASSVSRDTDAVTPHEDAVTPMTRRGDSCDTQPVRDSLEGPVTKTSAPQKKSAPDSRFKPFYDLAYEQFRVKFMQPPTWGSEHAKGLQLFLRRSPQVTLDEWKRRYLAFLESTASFYQQQKGSLVFFTAKFDQFIEGPVLERSNSHGTSDGNTRKSPGAVPASARKYDGVSIIRIDNSNL